MAEAANSPDLRHKFEEQLGQSRGHLSRLEQVFQSLNETPKGMKCEGIIGIIVLGRRHQDV